MRYNGRGAIQHQASCTGRVFPVKYDVACNWHYFERWVGSTGKSVDEDTLSYKGWVFLTMRMRVLWIRALPLTRIAGFDNYIHRNCRFAESFNHFWRELQVGQPRSCLDTFLCIKSSICTLWH